MAGRRPSPSWKSATAASDTGPRLPAACPHAWSQLACGSCGAAPASTRASSFGATSLSGAAASRPPIRLPTASSPAMARYRGAGKPSTRQLSGNRHVRTNRATERQWRAGPDGQTALLDELPRNGSESHRALAQCGGVPSDLARLGNGQNPANPAEEACLTRFRYTTKDANR